MQKIADEYKALPAAVKFVNGANELGKRTWMKPMSFLAEIYFGINRFAYPTRNVMSAIPGMGYELGLADALEVAGKAIQGSQIESTGVKLLQTNVAEIEKLVGMIPGAALRGDTPVGEFVDVSKKFFGVIRGGGEVAQLSEQIMGSEIVLRTIKRELRNALKYGAIPETTDLIAASLDPKDAKVLQELALEYGGDVTKTLDTFRKFMGGAEETFRHTPMSERLQGFLDHYGNDKSAYADLNKALKEVQSVEEWRAAADAAWKKIEVSAEFSRTDKVNLSDDIPSTFVDDIKDAQRLKALPPDRIDNFERIIQATRNAKTKFMEVEESMKAYLFGQGAVNGLNFKGYENAITTIRKQSETLEKADAVRNLVIKIRNDDTLTSEQIWKQLNTLLDPQDLKSYGISRFTEVDPNKITPQEMKRIMWESYFSWRGQHYADKMNDYVSDMTAVFEGMAQQLGKTVGQVAKESGSPIEQATKTVNETYKFLMQQQVDVMSFTRRFTPDGTTLADVSIDAIKQAGYNSQSHLFNTVNKYRREMGEAPWRTFEEVPMWEVQDAVRRAKREMGLVPASGKANEVKNTVNKNVSKTKTSSIGIEEATKVPRSDLSPQVSDRIAQEAKRLSSDLSGGQVEKASYGGRIGSSNPDWYKELYDKGLQKPAIDKALDKIIADHGKDKGINVERMKQVIIDNFTYGDIATGTPPDLMVLQELGADDSVIQRALDNYNEITRQELTLQEAIKQSGGSVTENISDDVTENVFGEFEPMLHPPLADDQPVTGSRMMFESLENAKVDYTNYVDGIASRWGETTAPAGALTDEVEQALGKWASTMQERVFRAQTEAVDVASATRDALLYDYRKTLGNVAAQYISPFHYYHLSASKQWLHNTAADPKWGAIYVDYKEYMANKHAGLPDYWKQNVAVSGLFGIDVKNPLFFNIEASVNPLYQMIGVDYNNPEKRADWLSSSVDSLGKIVPGLYQPLQWAVAGWLYSQGEKEAANQWWGRLIPQTRLLKTTSNALGINLPTIFKNNETDPFVGLFMDGLDPSETKKALLYLSTIQDVGGIPVTEEMRIQAANEHSGPLWDEAVRDSLSARALPEAISYFAGVGYKPRNCRKECSNPFLFWLQVAILLNAFFDNFNPVI